MADDGRHTLPREHYDATSQATRPVPQLFVVLESQSPLSGGSRHALEEIDEVHIGRGTARQAERKGRRLTLTFADPLMSSSHAVLRRAGKGWVASDAGSTNGTLNDGERTSGGPLQDGALLEAGGTLLVLRSDTPTPYSCAVDATAATLLAKDRGMATFLPGYAAELAALVQMSLSRVFVLLLGETGTGKEVLARGIHGLSGRRGAFIAVNCGALPESLVESQLFGHTKGSFSGALRDEPGFVRASDRGTLLLDEVGDLPRTSQAALLRVLQESEVTSVGATQPVKVDLRVVSATHRRVDALASGDAFRADLYARLSGFTHELLPLRERKEDLGLLLADILPRVASGVSLRLSPDFSRALFAYDWPLNVRELAQCLASTAVFAKDGVLHLSRAPDALRKARFTRAPKAKPEAPGARSPEDEALREELKAALERHAGNVSLVARTMGRTRMQIHRWMKRFGIDPEAHRR